MNHSSLNADLLRPMVAAVQKQLSEHIAPAWDRRELEVVPGESPLHLSAQDLLMVLFDDGDQATGLGWHAVGPQGQPFGRVFVNPVLALGGAVLHDDRGRTTVASVLSHEIAEAFIDRFCSTWVDGPPTMYGSSYALEIADPVQNDIYPLTLADGQQVSVSNFVHPAWFRSLAPLSSQFDQLHHLWRPFSTVPGGYYVVRGGTGRTAAISDFAPGLPWKLQSLRHPAARTTKRMTTPMGWGPTGGF